MPVIESGDGPLRFGSWSYILQGRGGEPLDPDAIGVAAAGLVVTDYSRDGSGAGAFTPSEVAAMRGAGADWKALLAYISIGESEDFRAYWNPAWTRDGTAGGRLTGAAPDWLGPLNPEWPDSRKIRYWHDDWQEIAFDWIATIAAQGFDGAYLDIVDAYYFWAHEARDRDRAPGDPRTGSEAAEWMAAFIVELAAHARAINPHFVLVQQNAPFLLSDLVYDTGGREKPHRALVAAYHDAVAGIALEDLYLRGGRDEDNRFRPDKAAIKEILRSYADAGEFVLSVDYARKPGLIETYLARAADDGFVPYAAPDRGLAGAAAVGTGGADVLVGDGARDRIYGRGGKDKLSGEAGADVLLGNQGDDKLWGGRDDDRLFGGSGADRLKGGAGADHLTGGKGRDVFMIDKGRGRDVIHDFGRGDRLDLSAFDGPDIRLAAHGDGTLVKINEQRVLLLDVPLSAIDPFDFYM